MLLETPFEPFVVQLTSLAQCDQSLICYDLNKPLKSRIRAVSRLSKSNRVLYASQLQDGMDQYVHHDSLDKTVPVDQINLDDNTVFAKGTTHPSSKQWWVYSLGDYLRSIDRLDVPVAEVVPGTWALPNNPE